MSGVAGLHDPAAPSHSPRVESDCAVTHGGATRCVRLIQKTSIPLVELEHLVTLQGSVSLLLLALLLLSPSLSTPLLSSFSSYLSLLLLSSPPDSYSTSVQSREANSALDVVSQSVSHSISQSVS